MKYEEPRFENVQVGERLRPLPVVADEHYPNAAMFSLDHYMRWYLAPQAAFGNRVLVASTAIGKNVDTAGRASGAVA